MRTRKDIEAQIRHDNPTSDGNGPGHPDYESLVARWTEAAWQREREESRKVARAELALMWNDPETVPIEISGPYGAEFRLASEYLDAGRDDLAAQVIRFAEPRSGYDAAMLAKFEGIKLAMAAKIAALPK